MPLIGLFFGRGPSGFGYNSTAEEVTVGRDLHGKTYLVTGCNAGLGTETVRVLALRGARVVATARSVDKAKDALRGVKGEVVPLACELAEPSSVRACVEAAKKVGKLDGIVANAGIMALPERQLAHGYELQFFTNHMGHFILVTGLLDSLTADGRVVVLSSSAHRGTYREGIRLDDLAAERSYTAWGAYGQSKLANMLFARQLANRLPKGQTAYAVHPGVIATSLARHMSAVARASMEASSALFLKSIPQGAATQCYCATHPDVTKDSGRYFADCNVARPTKHGENDELARALWKKSEEIAASV